MSKLGLSEIEAVDLTALRGGRDEGRSTGKIGHSAIRAASTMVDTRFVRPAKAAERVIKDSFTFPREDYDLINALVNKAMANGKRLGKSAVLRAGLRLLNTLNEADFADAIVGIQDLNRGRRQR